MRHRSGRVAGRIALDDAGAGRAAQRPTRPIAVDEIESLCGIVRVRTRLAHRPSKCRTRSCAEGCGQAVSAAGMWLGGNLFVRRIDELLLILVLPAGCGPRAHIPVRTTGLTGVLKKTDSLALLARSSLQSCTGGVIKRSRPGTGRFSRGLNPSAVRALRWSHSHVAGSA